MYRVFACVLMVGVMVGCGDDEEQPTPPKPDLFSFTDTWTVADSKPGACSPASCLGCCLGNDCMQGNTTHACGAGGNPCMICGNNEDCQGGTCAPAACGPTTCSSGCCDPSGECQSGGTEAACGSGGAICVACTGTDLCVQSTCEPKPPDSYKVILVSAALSSTIPWLDCDIGSKCDPFVVLTVNGNEFTSSVINNDHNPMWNEHLTTASVADLTTEFKVKFYDDDPIGKTVIGECGLALTAADLSSGSFTHKCGDWSAVVWKFSPP